MDTVTRFNDRADDYVRYRPTYPSAAIDSMLADLGPLERTVAADVGAGTGISARLIADRGVRVIAVEPGEPMRRAAAPHRDVVWVAAMAEATALRSASVDLVLSAQAFHWFRPDEALAEFARILKPGGRLAIMWNRRSRADPLTARFRQAILDAGGESSAEQMPFDPAVIAASRRFSAPQRLGFPNFQRLDLDGFIGRAWSASYVPKAGAAADELLDALRSLHARHADEGGCVTLVCETEIYRSVATAHT